MPGNYQYDAIGNLIVDQQSNISNVNWSVYGKIQSISKTDGPDFTYTYYPDQKRATQLWGGITTYYVRDAQGNTLAIYDNKGGQVNWREQDLYGSSRLGMWTPNVNLANNNASTVWDTIGHKQYELTNHLGNVLATITDKRIPYSPDGTTIAYYQPEVTTAQEYFAFGFPIPARNYTLNQPYRYGFNGKENDNQVKLDFNNNGIPGSQQDYGERIYDPRVGRFLSVDPLTGNYPWYTPYQFAGNTPIQAIDLDGLEPAYSDHGRRVVAREGVLARTPPRPQIKLVPAKVVPEITIAMADRTGHGWIGPESWVREHVGAVEQEHRDEVTNNVISGPLGAIAYLIGGDKWSYVGAIGDGIAMSSSNIKEPVFLGPEVKTEVDGLRVGSGPAAGALEVSPNVKSVAQFKNYVPASGIEFIFDPETNTLVVGKLKKPTGFLSPHENLAYTIGADPNKVVGGILRRGSNGEIITDEQSGHYWRNWTPEIRKQYVKFLESITKQKVVHH